MLFYLFMKIFIERTQEHLEKNFSGSVKELLDELNTNSQEVLIIKNGELVTEDEDLTDLDEIKLLSIISGG